MQKQKYSVNHQSVDTILAWIKSNEIAIPEIQRPFVWSSSKVRDLLDSLFQGYPIGYLITWKNPDVKLKDGKTSFGKRILIDGQQRIMALTAAILGEKIINDDYRKARIKIAFHPIKQEFEVSNPAIEKDVSWISDISPLLSSKERLSKIVREYCKKNHSAMTEKIEDILEDLKQISSKQIGIIELEHDLDIETVTEIFIRINSQGVILRQADFVMSKLAANEEYKGSILRKCIDYFCHLAIAPEFYSQIVEVDKNFINTIYFQKMSWLKSETDDLYDPKYTDLLRVAFTSEFNRGKLSDLVSLLSGRNFETKTYEEEIVKKSFATLEQGILNYINEIHFKRFVMIIRSAGFISSNLIRSQNALNFAYIIYLKLKSLNINPDNIEKYVRKWFVLSVLTGRYSGSPETRFDFDIKQIANREFKEYLNDVEKAELSDAFWSSALIQNMNTSVASSPFFNVYLASQVKANDKGFLSKNITVSDLITHRGDIHHIFPREYLKKHDLKRGDYNQIANYVYMQSEINVKIGTKPPKEYFKELKEQCNEGEKMYGGIDSIDLLLENLRMQCIPEDIFNMDINNYDKFLQKRRILLAQKIKEYYLSL